MPLLDRFARMTTLRRNLINPFFGIGRAYDMARASLSSDWTVAQDAASQGIGDVGTFLWQQRRYYSSHSKSRYAKEGRLVHREAAQFFLPNAVRIQDPNHARGVRKTIELIQKNEPVIEGTVTRRVNGRNVFKQPDALHFGPEGWTLAEFKSSVKPTRDHIEDMARTVVVATPFLREHSGFGIAHCVLGFLNPRYKVGMPEKFRFSCLPLTDDVLLRAQLLEKQLAEVASLKKTTSSIGFFKGANEPLALSNHLYHEMNQHKFPLSFLHMQSLSRGHPTILGAEPYQKIPRCYTVLTQQQENAEVLDSGFMIKNHHEDTEILLTAILHDLGTKGSIIVFSPFEKTLLEQMAKAHPRFQNRIRDIIDRIIVLQPLLRTNYTNPHMTGHALGDYVATLAPELWDSFVEGCDVNEFELHCQLTDGSLEDNLEAKTQAEIDLQIFGTARVGGLFEVYSALRRMAKPAEEPVDPFNSDERAWKI